MKATLTLGISLLLFLHAYSQAQLSQEFEIITMADMQYEPAFEPDAPAVVLFDIGDTRFETISNGYKAKFTTVYRIKILTEEGLEKANQEIYYYAENSDLFELVNNIHGNTYNVENDKIVKTELDLKEVYDQQQNKYYKKKIFTMPNVKVGSVIEIKYDHYPLRRGEMKSWNFQTDIPVVYSKYVARMIPFYTHVVLSQGITKFDEYTADYDKIGVARVYASNGMVEQSFYDYIHTYVMKEVPSLKDESYTTGREHVVMKIYFQLAESIENGQKFTHLTTWPKLADDRIKSDYFGKYQKKCEKAAAKIIQEELDFSGLNGSDYEKSKLIINYVKNNFLWTNVGGIGSDNLNPNKLIDSKSGTVGDINLFLTGMLNAAGIDAKPVISSTRYHGKVWIEYPIADFFNYVLVLVNTEKGSFLADGTDPNTPYNRLPIRCINGQGLIIDEEPGWVDLYTDVESLEKTSIKITVDADSAKAQTIVIKNLTEYDSYAYKDKFKNDKAKIKDHFLDLGYKNIKSVQSRFYDNPDVPYMIAFGAQYALEQIDGKILVKPFINFPIAKNPFTQKTRTYPVDFIYRQSKEYSCAVTIPDGYKASYIPKSYQVDNSLIEIIYNTSVSGNIIDVSGSIRYKKAIYNSEEYADLQRYFDIIVRQFNDAIVLEK